MNIEQQNKIVRDIKNIILNATQIPKGAKDPTRDATVILGEKLVLLVDDYAKKLTNEHPTEDGWCCACGYDRGVFERKLKVIEKNYGKGK